MEKIYSYIKESLVLNDFFEKFLTNRKVIYTSATTTKSHFLPVFTVRYDINYELNKRDLYGGKDLIDSLNNYDSEEIIQHFLRYEDHYVTIISDPASELFFGFYLVKEGKVYGECL